MDRPEAVGPILLIGPTATTEVLHLPLRKVHIMKKLMLIAGAGAVGYVLGARAGRPTYDKLADTVGRITRSGGLDEAADKVVTAGMDLRDAATQRAADKVKDLSSSAATQLADAADSARQRVGPPTEKS